jgi:hypothetical protein
MKNNIRIYLQTTRISKQGHKIIIAENNPIEDDKAKTYFSRFDESAEKNSNIFKHLNGIGFQKDTVQLETRRGSKDQLYIAEINFSLLNEKQKSYLTNIITDIFSHGIQKLSTEFNNKSNSSSRNVYYRSNTIEFYEKEIASQKLPIAKPETKSKTEEIKSKRLILIFTALLFAFTAYSFFKSKPSKKPALTNQITPPKSLVTTFCQENQIKKRNLINLLCLELNINFNKTDKTFKVPKKLLQNQWFHKNFIAASKLSKNLAFSRLSKTYARIAQAKNLPGNWNNAKNKRIEIQNNYNKIHRILNKSAQEQEYLSKLLPPYEFLNNYRELTNSAVSKLKKCKEVKTPFTGFYKDSDVTRLLALESINDFVNNKHIHQNFKNKIEQALNNPLLKVNKSLDIPILEAKFQRIIDKFLNIKTSRMRQNLF